jgi:hypothetical protein
LRAAGANLYRLANYSASAPNAITLDATPPTNDKEPSMNNRNPAQRNLVPPPAPAPASTPTYLNVFTVEEFESNGKPGKRWTKIGAAFPHKEGNGFSIELKAFPMDGRLVALPPDGEDNRSNK